MSLDVQLSPFLTKQLYKNNLYDLSSSSAGSERTYIGGYAQKILILVAEKEHPFISEGDLEFLVKILLPCSLAISDVALVNTLSPSIKEDSIITHFSPEKVIMFGVDQENLSLPLRFPDYQVQHFGNCNFLSAPPLSALQNDAAGKKELWTSLRKLFSLN